jgi:hypothetical protein
MKMGLDKMDLSCYTWGEIETMMTTHEGVPAEVLKESKKMVNPGCPVSRKMWKIAYGIVRDRAIDETRVWKQKHITIERV